MAIRFSSDVLKRQGAQKTVRIYSNQFVNTFANSNGSDQAAEPATVSLSGQLLETGAINGEQFQVARSFFNRRGLSDSMAVSMALLMLDIAKMNKTSVMAVLDPLYKNEDLILEYATYVQLNLLRPVSNKQGLLEINTNIDSPKKRLIIT